MNEMILAVAAVVLCAGTAFAQAPQTASGTRMLFTPRGPAITTGQSTGVQSAFLPDGGTGIVINNGNGTSTITGSNGLVTTVPNSP